MYNTPKTRISFAAVSIVLVAGLTAVWAGGFWIEAEAPSADAAAKGLVALIRPVGCHQPSDAVFQGSAEGLVDGRRQTVPLKLTVNSSGLVKVKRVWPEEGVWVLSITANYRGMTRSLLLPVGDSLQKHAKSQLNRAPSRKEIKAALQELSG